MRRIDKEREILGWVVAARFPAVPGKGQISPYVFDHGSPERVIYLTTRFRAEVTDRSAPHTELAVIVDWTYTRGEATLFTSRTEAWKIAKGALAPHEFGVAEERSAEFHAALAKLGRPPITRPRMSVLEGGGKTYCELMLGGFRRPSYFGGRIEWGTGLGYDIRSEFPSRDL